MNDSNEKLKILLICDRPVNDAGTISDHIDSFSRYSGHQIFTLSTRGKWSKGLKTEDFDVLVIHYSIYILGSVYLNRDAKKFVRDFQGLKVQFIQDEYRTVNAIIEEMRFLGIDLLFTCYPEQEIEKVYPESRLPGVRKVNTLTGYVPCDLLDFLVPSTAFRTIDAAYRARKVPLWLGRLGAEKWQIVPKFLEVASASKLVLDLAVEEEERLYGRRWIRFLASSKTVLGTESGASVVDFTGEIQQSVEDYLRGNPSASFDEIEERFLSVHEGKIRMNQISPRCFEAAALKTVMILFEGEYSGILKPGRHFISLKKDFSNVNEVIAAINNPVMLQEIADCTYEEIARNPNYSFKKFISGFDSIVEEEFSARKKTKSSVCLTEQCFEKRIRIPKLLKIPAVLKWSVTLIVLSPFLIVLGLFYFLLRRIRVGTTAVIKDWMKVLPKSWSSSLSKASLKFLEIGSLFISAICCNFIKIKGGKKLRPLSLLILYRDDWHYPMRMTVKDHLNALRRYFPNHRYFFHNAKFDLPRFIESKTFDAILLHNTFLCLRWIKKKKKRWAKFANQIKGMKGLKIAIPQDEYDHAHVLDDFLADSGVKIIFSNFDGKFRPFLYPKMSQKAEFQKVLTGYLSQHFVDRANRAFRPYEKRGVDVGYRATRLPEWFGKWGQMKSAIAPVVEGEAKALGLKTDISTEKKDEIYGNKWIRFLSASKAVIGCEGGSSILDADGSAKDQIGYEDERFRFRALSPRHLECAATRTVQILIEGDYGGVLKPSQHYIPIKEDLTNVREALEKLKDRKFSQKMTETAYREIVQSGFYSDEAFAEQLMLTVLRYRRYSGEPGRIIGGISYFRYLIFTFGIQLRKWFTAPFYFLGRMILRNEKGRVGRTFVSLYRRKRQKEEKAKPCAA
ncbi:MAG: hypothetical protein HZC17_05495 [Candidatus Omnitrophica bacterium]|nr:hypothetical protein [Candidatus Omnitrophota bacterium]